MGYSVRRISRKRGVGFACQLLRLSRRSHRACQRAVADAFFQAGGNEDTDHEFPVNDFPVIEHSEENGWRTGDGSGGRGEGCAEFAEQQDRLAS